MGTANVTALLFHRRSLSRFVLLACVSLAAWLFSSSAVIAQSMRIHLVDVGQGASTLIEFPCAAMLIDTGGESNKDFDSTKSLMEYLNTFFEGRPDLKSTLHSLVLTHP